MYDKLLDWQFNARYKPEQIIPAMGRIPEFVLADDPRPAHEQIDERYAHGGGWNAHLPGKWQMDQGDWLLYPGDPALEPLAFAWHGEERIVIYPHAFVAIITGEAFSVARLD